jgi:hypothetical protein
LILKTIKIFYLFLVETLLLNYISKKIRIYNFTIGDNFKIFPIGVQILNWEITWFGILVRLIVTVVAVWLFIRLLREKFTTARVNAAVLVLIALGVLWLADIEGATRLVFLGIEIDKSVERAEDILSRLSNVEKVAQNTKNNLQNIQKEASKTASELSILIDNENQKFEIRKLQDRALDGDFKAYESLKNYQSDDLELIERAKSAIINIKGFYIGKTKIKGIKLHRTNENGTLIEEDEFETSWLIEDLMQNQKWEIRTRAAKLLARRKELGVPEALLNAMESDPNLWVRKEALDSFENITEYEARDVFYFETGLPRSWYQLNKDKIQKKLSNPENS